MAGPQHLPIEVLSVLRKIALREDSPAVLTARRTLAELDLDLIPLARIGGGAGYRAEFRTARGGMPNQRRTARVSVD